MGVFRAAELMALSEASVCSQPPSLLKAALPESLLCIWKLYPSQGFNLLGNLVYILHNPVFCVLKSAVNIWPSSVE